MFKCIKIRLIDCSFKQFVQFVTREGVANKYRLSFSVDKKAVESSVIRKFLVVGVEIIVKININGVWEIQYFQLLQHCRELVFRR